MKFAPRQNCVPEPGDQGSATRALLGIALIASLSACVSLAPEQQRPSLASDLPDQYAAPATPGNFAPAEWWRQFDDPVLNQLVGNALGNNLDVIEAVGRVEQASAQARLARSALLPTVSLSGDASSTSTPLDGNAFSDLAGGVIDRLENEAYTLSLGASYEIDLFGRARNDLAAARQDAVASEFDLRAIQLAAAAETISAYFDLVDTRRQIELTRVTIETLEDRAERTDDRFQRGLAESFELYQVRQDLRSTQASLPQLESTLVALRARIALLTGAYPEALSQQIEQDLRPRLVFEPVPSGLPSDLLEQRPDVAAAWARLDAARLRIGARRAERFPTLTLGGSYGTQAGDFSGAFDFASNWATSLAASIVAPIIDGGRISANIRSARAVYDQQAAAYARAVLTAYGEVDSAIADYGEQRARYLLITQQLTEAEASLDLQRRRFASGVGSYVSYLDALRTVYLVETNLSSAARATAQARLGVHRALGGDWAPESQPLSLEMQPQAGEPTP